jgi:hypothetical protein
MLFGLIAGFLIGAVGMYFAKTIVDKVIEGVKAFIAKITSK